MRSKATLTAMLLAAASTLNTTFRSNVDQKNVVDLAMYAQARKRERQVTWSRAHYKLQRRLKALSMNGRSGAKGEQRARIAARKAR